MLRTGDASRCGPASANCREHSVEEKQGLLIALLIGVAGLGTTVARADTPAGFLDPTFGSGGVSEVGLGAAPFSDVAAYETGPESGKVVAVFATTQPPFTIDLARFDSNGGLDPSFGVNGVVTTSLEPDGTGPFGSGKVGQVAIDPSGGIFLSAYDRVLGRPVLARFTETGALDDGAGQPGAGFGHCGCGFADLGTGLIGFAVTKAGEIVYTVDTPPPGATGGTSRSWAASRPTGRLCGKSISALARIPPFPTINGATIPPLSLRDRMEI